LCWIADSNGKSTSRLGGLRRSIHCLRHSHHAARRSPADVVEIKRGEDMKSKSTETKPSIVFCHGLWADGSCFSKLIVPLQAEGYECIAAQYGLNTTAEDVALVRSA